MKIKLSGDIASILYLMPIVLVFSTLIIIVTGFVEEQIKDLYPIFGIFGLIFLIIWILLLRCKIVYFDNENIYVHTPFNNKLIKKIDLAKISHLTSRAFLIKITCLVDAHKKRNFYTIPDRKTMDSEMGFSGFPGYKFFFGKPRNRILVLKELIKNRRKTENGI